MKPLINRERVLAVIKREIPDRVPHFEFLVDDEIIKSITRGGTYEDLVELLDYDAVTAKADYELKKIGKNRFIDEWGVTRAKGIMQATIPLDDFAPVKSLSDLNNWNPPDPFSEDRLLRMKEFVRKYKGKRALFIHVRDVWSLPRDVIGYMDLMVACISMPELVIGVIEKGIEHNIKIVEQAADLGVEFVFTGDDIADNRSTLVSPKMWEEIFAPYFCKLMTAMHDLGLYIWKHSDGNLMPVMDSLIDAGIDGIDPVDPLGGMSLKIMKEKYGNKVAIKGNVDCVNTLVSGTKQQVIDEVKRCIKTAGPGGGYVCSSSNSIHSGVAHELYSTMVATIHEFGVYPLDMDQLSSSKQVNKLDNI